MSEMKLVPVVPTESMLVNGREALLPLITLNSYGPLIGVWHDMLSAAPVVSEGGLSGGEAALVQEVIDGMRSNAADTKRLIGPDADKIVGMMHARADAIEKALATHQAATPDGSQVAHMVDRFLSWRLPANFNPDNGISFKAEFNEHTAHPMRCNPTGTNLFDRTQAEAMVRHMIDGLPQ